MGGKCGIASRPMEQARWAKFVDGIGGRLGDVRVERVAVCDVQCIVVSRRVRGSRMIGFLASEWRMATMMR